MERVTVEVPGRAYDVVIGAGMLDRGGRARAGVPLGRRTRSSCPTGPWGSGGSPCSPRPSQRCGLHCVPLTVPAGEAAKSLDVYGTLLHQLATQEAHRADPS